MATARPSPRRKPRENQYLFEVGVRGRKTGLTVPDSGIRDEYGLEPMDDLFSSPEKLQKPSKPRRSTGAKNPNATISSEEDMDVGGSTIPEPAAVLTERKISSMRMPPPKSKSPIKTFLQSPARRHPSLGPVSSPTRGSIVSPSRAKVHASVNRRLDFSVDDLDRNIDRPPVRDSPQKQSGLQKQNFNSFTAKLTNGTRFSPITKSPLPPTREDEQDPHAQLSARYDYGAGNDGDSYQIMGDDYGDDDQQYQDEEQEVPGSSPEVELESPLQATKKRRRVDAEEPSVKPGKRNATSRNPEPSRGKLRANEEVEERRVPVRDADERPAKRPRSRPKAAETSRAETAKKPVSKAAAKKAPSPSRISSPPEVQRGPPRPKNNRGLYILRRETPDDGFHTRSGRHVIKPVAYWKNETVVYGDDEDAEGDASFLLPTIKEVIRADHVEQPKASRAMKKGSGGAKSRKARQESETEEEDELVEPWEEEPGRVYGAIRTWNPEDPIGEESEEREEEIALSNAAINTREIAGASFRFAKTLTLPFFGSGMVDLPPGTVKKPKNSRRMQLVFFVFYGRVSVTINDTVFRIGKGGMWQVPRGNFYSIENDYDKPARIFFSQGCEVLENADES